MLREHESVRIGERWDTRARTVPERVASEIERLQAGSRVGYFSVGRHVLRATSFVGTVGFDDGALDVLPKVDGAGNAETRSRLLEMLSFAGLVPHAEGSVTGLGRVPSTLLDAFLTRYVRGLALEWRRGRIRSYVRVDRDRPALRGKFLFAAQLRRNVLRPERFHTRADEFLEDVPVSRLLKAGLEVCRHYAISEEPRREAAELLVEFEQVSGGGLSPEDVARVTVDRRSERFAPLVELARLLVARASPWEPGRPRTYALLFDMDVVFERFIGALLQRVVCPPGRSAALQLARRSLLVRSGAPVYRLRPDVGVFERGRLVCLLDTKWKRLEPLDRNFGVAQDDMYQMYAYGKEYGCPLVVLLYPQHGDLKARVASYRHPPGEDGCSQIEVATVPLGLPAVLPSRQCVATELRSLLDGLLQRPGSGTG